MSLFQIMSDAAGDFRRLYSNVMPVLLLIEFCTFGISYLAVGVVIGTDSGSTQALLAIFYVFLLAAISAYSLIFIFRISLELDVRGALQDVLKRSLGYLPRLLGTMALSGLLVGVGVGILGMLTVSTISLVTGAVSEKLIWWVSMPPAIVFTALMQFVPCAVVLENKTVINSIGYSYYLAKRQALFAVGLVSSYFALSYIGSFVSMLFVTALSTLFPVKAMVVASELVVIILSTMLTLYMTLLLLNAHTHFKAHYLETSEGA